MLLVLAAACGREQGPPDRPASLRAEELFSVGQEEGSQAESFSGVAAVAFDGAGNLFVVDRGRRVLVFDPAGRFVRQVGRPGNAPGELQDPVDAAVAPDGRLIVSDLARRAFSVFDARGALLQTVPYDGRFGLPGLEVAYHPAHGLLTLSRPIPVLGRVAADSNFLVAQPLAPGSAPVRLYAAPEAVSPGETKGRGRGPPAFAPRFLWGVFPDGSLAVACTAAYQVRILDRRGATRAILARPLHPRRVTRRDRDRERQRERELWQGRAGVVAGQGGRPAPHPSPGYVEARVRSLRFARVVPVIHALRVDAEGTLWVQRENGGGGGGAIDLFRGGAYVGTLRGAALPDAFGPGGRAAFVEEDESGVQRVRVRRLQIAPGARAGA